jgi:hypothetical protein
LALARRAEGVSRATVEQLWAQPDRPIGWKKLLGLVKNADERLIVTGGRGQTTYYVTR